MTNSESSFDIDTRPTDFVERRGKPRVKCSYPAQLNGYSSGLMKFEARAVLTNMSASGMYLRLNRRLEVGQSVFIVVRLSTAAFKDRTTPIIAADCSVVRVEPKTDGTYGVAVQMDNHRFP